METIDLYLLHRPDFLADPAEIASAFDALKRAGKVREFGVSNFRPSLYAAVAAACPMPLVVNQVEISPAKLDAFEDGTLHQCLERQVTPVAWSPPVQRQPGHPRDRQAGCDRCRPDARGWRCRPDGERFRSAA